MLIERTSSRRSILLFSSFILASSGCQRTPRDEAAVPAPTTKKTALIARCTHSVGLCNLPLFIAHADRATSAIAHFGIDIELKSVPDWGKHAIALDKGDVDFSVTPFTNVMVAYAAGTPLRIIAGSGINGLRLVAARPLDSPEKLRGKRIGTFRADTLEMMLYTYLTRNGLGYKDVEVVYFDDSFGLLSAFKSGKVDALTHVEPYATRAMTERDSVVLATGEGPGIWAMDHPDCVLVTTSSQLQKPEGRDTARRLILAMLTAQETIERDPEAAARRTAQQYFRGNTEDIVRAAKTQRPGVDIRAARAFMSSRFEDLKKLGYIPTQAQLDALLDLALLQEILATREAVAPK